MSNHPPCDSIWEIKRWLPYSSHSTELLIRWQDEKYFKKNVDRIITTTHRNGIKVKRNFCKTDIDIWSKILGKKLTNENSLLLESRILIFCAGKKNRIQNQIFVILFKIYIYSKLNHIFREKTLSSKIDSLAYLRMNRDENWTKLIAFALVVKLWKIIIVGSRLSNKNSKKKTEGISQLKVKQPLNFDSLLFSSSNVFHFE